MLYCMLRSLRVYLILIRIRIRIRFWRLNGLKYGTDACDTVLYHAWNTERKLNYRITE